MKQTSETSSVITRALDIACRDLRSCYLDPGIIAGHRYFDDFWARDSFFASWGALALGDVDVVRNVLDLFITHQRSDGLIARRLNRYWIPSLKYVTQIRIPRQKLLPSYYGRAFAEGIDGNSLFVIAADRYLETSHDEAWLVANLDSIDQSIRWLQTRDTDLDGLIEEGKYAGWMDTIAKQGEVLYSNVLLYGALEAHYRMYSRLGKPFPARLAAWRGQLSTQIHEVFWNGHYFSDWFEDESQTRFDYFSSAANLLAMYVGVADVTQSDHIMKMISRSFRHAFSPQTNTPMYDKTLVSWNHRYFGASGYHNAFGVWSWIAALYAVMHFRLGNRAEAYKLFTTFARYIVAHQAVYEVYEPNGQPYASWLWRSEVPFAWGAGMVIWAAGEMGLLDEYTYRTPLVV
jgi:glycogen debranching enzyme